MHVQASVKYSNLLWPLPHTYRLYDSYLLLAGGALCGPLPGVGLCTTAGRKLEAPSIMRMCLVGKKPSVRQHEGAGVGINGYKKTVS